MDAENEPGDLRCLAGHIKFGISPKVASGGMALGRVLLVVGWEFKSHPAIWAWSWGVAVFNLLWWTLAPRLGVKLGIAQRMVIYTTTVWLTIMAAWIMWR